MGERLKLDRKQTGRIESESALLVCEGGRTEPYYLNGLLTHLRISAASAEIIPGRSKSNAVAIVNRARERFAQNPRDRVFVVIDGEQNDVAVALQKCKTPLQRSNVRKGLPEIRIEPIVSTPCFEVWLLLHFRYCDQPFLSYADVLPVLQAQLPAYSKVDPHVFLKVGAGEGLKRALVHAARLRTERMRTGSTSPATNMDELVQALRVFAAKPFL